MLATIHWHSFFFLFFAMAACAFALAVVFSGSIVRMAFYLVLSLGATAGLFFLAGAEFLGAVQLMVYVGGTLVLLVFGVMLTARGPFVSLRTGGGQWILALLAGGALLAVLLQAAFGAARGPAARAKAPSPRPRCRNPRRRWAWRCWASAPIASIPPMPAARTWPATCWSLKSSRIHLLVVLVGAAYLARAKRRVRETEWPQDE